MAFRKFERTLASGTLILLTVTASLATGSTAHSAASKGFSYTGFSAATGITLNGSASISGSVLRLSDTNVFTTAAAWHNTPIDPSASFESMVQVSLHDGTDPPADGIALVIQSSDAGAAAIGGFGEGIGYGGITSSIEVEFDTWLNEWDPDANHVAVTTNGDEKTSVALAQPPFAMHGTPFTAWVDYNAGAKQLAVYASQTSVKPVTALVTADLDLGAVLGATSPAYIGLTSGTGTNSEYTDVTSWSFSPAGTVVPAACKATPFVPKFESADSAILMVDTLKAGACAYTVVTEAGIRPLDLCPTNRSAYGTTPASLQVQYPGIGSYSTMLCATPAGSSTVMSTSRTQVATSPVYANAPKVYLAKGEKYFPDSTLNFIAKSRLTLDLPDLNFFYAAGGSNPASCTDKIEIESPSAYQLRDSWWKSAPVWKYHPPVSGKTPGSCYPGNTIKLNVAKNDVTDTGYALHLKTKSSRVGMPPTGGAYRSAPPVYFAYSPGEFISYWFFYDYDEYKRGFIKQLHEGDWEHVVVSLDSGSGDTGQNKPRTIQYHAHGCKPATYSWTDRKIAKVGTHPVVYSAAGSHASYPNAQQHHKPCSFEGRGVDDRTDRGAEWNTWSNLINVTEQPWFGFLGNWGSSVPESTASLASVGPIGPNPKTIRKDCKTCPTHEMING